MKKTVKNTKTDTKIPKRELWLFAPENKQLVDELKKALKQEADKVIDLIVFENDENPLFTSKLILKITQAIAVIAR